MTRIINCHEKNVRSIFIHFEGISCIGISIAVSVEPAFGVQWKNIHRQAHFKMILYAQPGQIRELRERAHERPALCNRCIHFRYYNNSNVKRKSLLKIMLFGCLCARLTFDQLRREGEKNAVSIWMVNAKNVAEIANGRSPKINVML